MWRIELQYTDSKSVALPLSYIPTWSYESDLICCARFSLRFATAFVSDTSAQIKTAANTIAESISRVELFIAYLLTIGDNARNNSSSNSCPSPLKASKSFRSFSSSKEKLDLWNND